MDGFDKNIITKRINDRTPENTDSSLIGMNFESDEKLQEALQNHEPKMEGINKFDNLIKIKFGDTINEQIKSVLIQLFPILNKLNSIDLKKSKKCINVKKQEPMKIIEKIDKTVKFTYFGIMFKDLEKHTTIAY